MKEIFFEKIAFEKYKEGDKSAFSSIFIAYYPDLVMFATRFLNDLDSSQEIVQDVFVKFWEDRQKIVIASSLKSYLLKSVQNKCLDWLRHLKITDQYADTILSTSTLLDYNTENYVLRSELEYNIEKILDQLPEEFAIPFRLNRYDGLKYHEIAEKLHVSQRTVEVRIGKALYALRKNLAEYFITVVAILFSIFS